MEESPSGLSVNRKSGSSVVLGKTNDDQRKQGLKTHEKTAANMKQEQSGSRVGPHVRKTIVKETPPINESVNRAECTKDKLGVKQNSAKYCISIKEDSETSFLYYTMFILVTLLAFVTRLYNIEVPAWIW